MSKKTFLLNWEVYENSTRKIRILKCSRQEKVHQFREIKDIEMLRNVK